MPVEHINPNPPAPIKLVYVPEFIYQVTGGLKHVIDMEKLHEVMNTSDLFHYQRLNQILYHMIGLDNQQLFDGFESVFQDHPFFTEREEEFQTWYKNVQAKPSDYSREDHPLEFNFKDLGNINQIEYDHVNRILYLVNLPNHDYQQLEVGDYARYQGLLTDILIKVGKYNPYEYLTSLGIFLDRMDVTKQGWFDTYVSGIR